MQRIKNKPLFLVFIILASITTILVFWRLLIKKEVQVLEVNPQPGATKVAVSSPIKVKFNKPIDLLGLAILTSPNIVGQSELDELKTSFIFTPESPLSYQAVYSVKIRYQNRPLFSWEFTTEEEPKKEMESQIKDKLIKLLPVNNENFSIEYFPTSQKFIVTIKKSPYSQNKQKALEWFKENGVEDPETTQDIVVTSARWIGD